MTDAVLILCTVPTAEDAATIARALVDDRLAACVQAHPIRSWYRWEGRVEEAVEHRLHIKTLASHAKPVEARIGALHPYDVPEIVTLPLTGGAAPYLEWVAGSVTPA